MDAVLQDKAMDENILSPRLLRLPKRAVSL